MKKLLVKLLRLDNEVLTELVQGLFCTISSDDILKEENGKWLFMGKFLNDSEKKLLIAEAEQFINTKLWQVLQTDIKYQANRKMFLEAQNEMQLTAGKLWLLTLDVFKTRLESLKNKSGLFNNKYKLKT